MEEIVGDEFRRQVDDALVAVGRVLDDESRKPRLAGSGADKEEDNHTSNDKFALAESVTEVAISALRNMLERMGLDSDTLISLVRIVKLENRSVTMRFEAQETCVFVEEDSHQTSSPHTSSETGENDNADVASATTDSSTALKSYRWKVGMDYSFSIFVGDATSDGGVLGSREGTCEVLTNTKEPPQPAKTTHAPIDVCLDWFLRCIDPETGRSIFLIDRHSQQCRTPRRNRDVIEAATFFDDFGNRWAEKICMIFHQIDSRCHQWRSQELRKGGAATTPTLTPARISQVMSSKIFVPVLPFLENATKTKDPTRGNTNADATTRFTALKSIPSATTVGSAVSTSSTSSPITSKFLPQADISKLLNEQCRTIDLAASKITVSFPSRKSTSDIITTAEAQLALLMGHAISICSHHLRAIDQIENMLRAQLMAAVGKCITEDDFEDFVKFHCAQKHFRKEDVPRAFCHPIRRPGHHPDGTLSIETKPDSPIQTFSKSLGVEDEHRFIKLPVNAGTEVAIGGQYHLHAWMLHRFGGNSGGGTTTSGKYQLVARASQFSCFMLLLGKISSRGTFDPQDAVIVKDKDEIFVPLLLEELAAPKEFRDALAFLSPEQRRFAEAYRQMQLESSVFGVCVVPLKPQLEVLLGLSPNSLAKEVKLTEDVMQLFMDYQIPSDLLSCLDNAVDKVDAVKLHVKNVQEMIRARKDDKLSLAESRAETENELFDAQTTISVESNLAPAGKHGRVLPRCVSLPIHTPALGFGGKRLQTGVNDVATLTEAQKAQATDQSASFTASSLAEWGTRLWKKAPFTESQSGQSWQTQETGQLSVEGGSKTRGAKPAGRIDFASIPKQLDAKLAVSDVDLAVRSTNIKAGASWTKTSYHSLSTPESQTTRLEDDQRARERNRAFDLLGAITRSGSLPIRCAEVHVIVAATQIFDKSAVDTVIDDSVNPIQKLERVAQLMAEVVNNI